MTIKGMDRQILPSLGILCETKKILSQEVKPPMYLNKRYFKDEVDNTSTNSVVYFTRFRYLRNSTLVHKRS